MFMNSVVFQIEDIVDYDCLSPWGFIASQDIRMFHVLLTLTFACLSSCHFNVGYCPNFLY